MPIEVEIPEHGVAEFPDDMTPDQIQGVIQKQFYAKPTESNVPREKVSGFSAIGLGSNEFSMPGQMAEDFNPLEAAKSQSSTESFIPIPQIPQQEGVVKQAGAALVNTASGLVNFATSPAGLQTLPAAVASPTLGRILGAVFAPEMISGGVKEAWQAPTLQGKLQGVLGAVLGVSGAVHAGGLREALKPVLGEPEGVPSVVERPEAGKPPVAPETALNETPISSSTGPEPIGTEPKPSETLGKIDEPAPPDAVPSVVEEPVRPAVDETAPKIEPVAPETTAEPISPASSQPSTADAAGTEAAQATTSVESKALEAVSEQPQSPTGIRNAIVDEQRKAKGLPERMEPLRKTNPEAWDAAMAKVDENPNAGRELIANIKDNQRALKPEESALLAHETVTRENAFDSAVEEVNNAKTPEALAEAKQRLDLARNEVQELYDVGQRTGTESGQSLQARKMLVNQDYSLAKMEAVKRAISNDGKPLSEKQAAEVKVLHDQLAELRAKLDTAENAKAQEKQIAMYRQLVKESLTSAKELAKKGGSLQAALDAAAAKARERIIARRGQLQVTIDPIGVAHLVDEAIIGASHLARGVTKFADWSAQMVKDFGERITPYLKELYDRAKAFHDANAEQFQKRTPQEIALARYKTTLSNKTEQLAEKVASGDFTKPVRNKTQLDDEAMKAKAAYERVRQQFETGLEKDRQAKRPMWQKTLEQIAGTARASALSGYHTLLKLATYDLAKLVETPATELAGGLISKVPGMRGIAAKANLESGSTFKAIADFYVGTATKGMKEAWNVLRTGKTEAKVLYGKPDYSPPKWYDWFGNLHMAEKAPLLTGTMKMYLRRATENAIKQGLDPSNEFTKAAINKAVYDYSQKSILQENNKFAEAVNGLQARMEAANPKTGQVDINKAILSTLVKTFLTKGIVRTPANYIAQTIARTPVGLIGGLAKAGMAHIRGIENLHPVEANAISALIKTGAVGSAFFLLGAIDATKSEEDRMFGGYWNPGRKKEGSDVEWGKIRIGSTTFPHIMTHNPLTESAQMGNTMMRVALSRFKKKDTEDQGLVKGSVKAIVGLAQKAPVASPVMRMGDARGNIVGDLLKGLVPQLLQNIAEDTDSVHRAPKTTLEDVESAIPGLRQNVPEKQEKGRKRF